MPGKACYMAHLRKLSLIAATFLITTCAVHSARASEPPADLCSLLPTTDVSKTLGQAFDSPQKSVAPRPFANTNPGTDRNYLSKDTSKLWIRAYVDPSSAAAAVLFAGLSNFNGTPPLVKGLGDAAHFYSQHAHQ